MKKTNTTKKSNSLAENKINRDKKQIEENVGEFLGNARILKSIDELPKLNKPYGYDGYVVIKVDKTGSKDGYDIYTVKSQDEETKYNNLGDNVDVATYTFAIKNEEDDLDESKLVEKPVYDLRPQYDSRQSFYGKARVNTGNEDNQNQLYSYGTLVAEIVDGVPRVYGTYSQTTLRHIKEWLKQLGFRAETSKQIIQDYGYNKYRGGRMRSESCKEDYFAKETESDETYVVEHDSFFWGDKDFDIYEFATREEAMDKFKELVKHIKDIYEEKGLIDKDDEYGNYVEKLDEEKGRFLIRGADSQDTVKVIKKKPKNSKNVKECGDNISIKESLPSNKKKSLKEDGYLHSYSDAYEIINECVEEVQDAVNEGQDVDEAIWEAIDRASTYNDDILLLAQHYGAIDYSALCEAFYDDFYNDIYSEIEEPEEVDEEDEYVESLMRKYGVESQKKESKSQPQRKSLKEAKKPIRRPSKRTPVKENKKVTKK